MNNKFGASFVYKPMDSCVAISDLSPLQKY